MNPGVSERPEGSWFCTRCHIVHVMHPKGQCPNDPKNTEPDGTD